MTSQQNKNHPASALKGAKKYLQQGEVVIMELPISPVSVLVPGIIQIIWLVALIYASYHWREIYNFLAPEAQNLFTGRDAVIALDRIWQNYQFTFSIALFGVIIAAIVIVWKIFRRALGTSIKAARESIFLPLTLLRDMYFFERIITDHRIITRSGVLRKDQDDRGFDAIKSTQISKSIIGNIFDYGDIFITDRLGYQLVLRQVTHPEQVAKQLSDFFGRAETAATSRNPIDITARGRENRVLDNIDDTDASGEILPAAPEKSNR